MNKNEENRVISSLLNIEMNYVCNKLKYTDVPYKYIDEKLLLSSIRLLDEMSMKPNDENNRKIILICAILWEHTEKKYDGLRDILVRFLSRIGYFTSSFILDETYDEKIKELKPLNSIIAQLMVNSNNFKYQVEIKNKTYILTDFQKKVWDEIEKKSTVIGISAPTSAGKSFAILLKIMDYIIKEDYEIVYIVPTLSLVNQVMKDFKEKIEEFNIKNYEILNAYNEENFDNKNKIYVLTQEKAIAAFQSYKSPFKNKVIFVTDEIQNIERVSNEDEMRSKILLDTLNEFRYKNNVEKIILSGPRIEELDELGNNIFRNKNKQIS